MRDIKFRAWDKNSSNIIGWDLLGKMVNGATVAAYERITDPKVLLDSSGVVEVYEYRGNPFVRKNFVLMQYTGLKDKNGVEIYEGDVVRYQYPQKQLKNHQQLCKVVYEPKAAAFLLLPGYFEPQVKYLGDIAKSNSQYDTRTYELCEVIGNIYENPELLK